jgi:membrane protease YdiL (CAAX protease family)
MPVNPSTGPRFWKGAAGGFAAISGVILVMLVFRGFHIAGIATGGVQLLQAFVLWALAFLIVGLSEEFTFRGYMQYTLTTGIGFWPAAIVTTCLFAGAHTGNPGESPIGIFEVALFAIVFCFVLLRTGNLWWGIGFHAAWDWGETFFYGVPDSGLKPWHPLLASSSSGPVWLTGGSAGPEGSVVTCIALLLVALYIARAYPRAQYPEVTQTLT